MEIYVDVLIFVNLIVDYLLLLTTKLITGSNTRRLRLFLAALLGAVYSLSIFLSLSSLTSIIFSILIAGLMVLIAFKRTTIGKFVKNSIIYFAVSFLFSGLMFGIWVLLSPNNMLISNGIVYINISPLYLIVMTSLCYISITIFYKLTSKRYSQKQIVPVSIHYKDKIVSLTGLLDTGNSLKESFSGSHVVVGYINDIAPLIPTTALPAFLHNAAATPLGMENNFRLIPYNVVGHNGVLSAFKPDKMVIYIDKKQHIINNFYLAASSNRLADEYSLILGVDILNNGSVVNGSSTNNKGQIPKTNDLDREENKPCR